MRRTLGTVKTYYDRRAQEYDDWWLGQGLYADRDRPGWDDDLRALELERHWFVVARA
jgi:hypothetical protein